MKSAHILTPTPIKGSWRPPSIDALKGVVEDSPRGSFLSWRVVFHPGVLFRRFVSQPGVFQQRAGVGLPGGLQGLRCSSFRMNLAFGTIQPDEYDNMIEEAKSRNPEISIKRLSIPKEIICPSESQDDSDVSRRERKGDDAVVTRSGRMIKTPTRYQSLETDKNDD